MSRELGGPRSPRLVSLHSEEGRRESRPRPKHGGSLPAGDEWRPDRARAGTQRQTPGSPDPAAGQQTGRRPPRDPSRAGGAQRDVRLRVARPPDGRALVVEAAVPSDLRLRPARGPRVSTGTWLKVDASDCFSGPWDDTEVPTPEGARRVRRTTAGSASHWLTALTCPQRSAREAGKCSPPPGPGRGPRTVAEHLDTMPSGAPAVEEDPRHPRNADTSRL